MWDLSCPDWKDRLRERRSLIPDLPLDLVAGDRAVAVFNKLRLADVPGTPTMADASGEWFRGIVRAIFGSVDRVTRERMIRELFVLVTKKNSKTTGGALGLMLTALLLNERPRASFIMTAPVQDVADLAYSAVSGAVGLDDVLSAKLHVRDHLKIIVHRETKATLEIMTFDPAVLTGQKVSGGVLIDELHVCAKMAKADKALRQLRGGMIPFPEAFLAIITTQSEDEPAGVFKDELDKARDIRDGKRVGRMLPVLYEFPEEMQKDAEAWQDPANWLMVTPNAGRSITIERLQEDFQTAKDTSEAELRAWATQHLNVQIGLAIRGGSSWAGAAHWQAAGTGPKTLEELLTRSEVVVNGVDGGGLDDLLGFAVMGREIDTGRWLHWGRAWAHRCVLERRKEIAPRLLDFEAQGDLVIVDDDSEEDVEELADIVKQCEDAGLLDRIGVDQAGLGGIVDAIEKRGIDHERIVGIPQGWRMVGAVKTAERKLAARTLLHADQALMAWAVGNAKAVARGNAVVIEKQTAGSAKIDPLMALLDCTTLMAMNPTTRKKKYQLFFA